MNVELPKPTNVCAADLLESITRAQGFLTVRLQKLRELQDGCDHDFTIVVQGVHVDDAGCAIFKHQKYCVSCGELRCNETIRPYCLDCGTHMPQTDPRDVTDHIDEFNAVQLEGSRDWNVFPTGAPKAYRCPACGRPHVYRDAGD